VARYYPPIAAHPLASIPLAGQVGVANNETASGGALCTGSAAVYVVYSATATSGNLAAGNSTQTAKYTVTATSGDLAAGDSTQRATYFVTATSGDLAAGDSTQRATYFVTATSGDLAAGDSTQRATYSVTATGGDLAAGSAASAFTYNATATSGDLAAGDSTQRATYSVTATAGVIADSSNQPRCVFVISATGGSLLGGAAAVSLLYTIPVGGTALVSGEANEAFSIGISFVAQKDLAFVYSGGTSNTDPSKSLGGTPSMHAIPNLINNLFDNVRMEHNVETTDYRAFYIINTNKRHTLNNVKLWADLTSTESQIAIGVGNLNTVSPFTGIKDVAPDGVTFGTPDSETDAIDIGAFASTDSFYVWVKRLIPQNMHFTDNLDGFGIKIKGNDANNISFMLTTSFKPKPLNLQTRQALPNLKKGKAELKQSIKQNKVLPFGPNAKVVSRDNISIVYSGGSTNFEAKRSVGGASSPYPVNQLFGKPSELTDYRAFYLFNDHDDVIVKNMKIWVDVDDTVADISISVGDINGVAPYTGFANNAPSGVEFVVPRNKDEGILIGDLRPMDGFYVWVKRVVPSGLEARLKKRDGFRLKFSATDSVEVL
jgi:hypothetical protein